MSSMNKNIRRVHTRHHTRFQYLIAEIRAGRCPNARSMAEKFECDWRTIMRDFEKLRDQHKAPLIYDRKRKEWRFTGMGWQLPEVPLDGGEMLAFFVAERMLKASGHTPEAELLRDGLAKLAARLPAEVSYHVSTLGESLTFQQAPHVKVESGILGALSRAAGERRTLTFMYHSQYRNEKMRRTADVLHLHNFADDWYAISYDHLRKAVRDFHVGRMSELRATKNFFEPPANWDKDAYLRGGFSMTRGGRKTAVSIVFDAYQARWMRERQTFHPDEQREELLDGSLRLSFPVGSNGLEAVARFVCTYAGHCRAERPAALRKLVRERLARALEDHTEDQP